MKSRWLVIIPALWFAFSPQLAKADPQPGLDAIGYTIDEIPPTQSDNLYPTCGSELENNINRNFDGEPFANCGWDYFMVHYTGYITIPENTTVEFMVAADDGGTVDIGGYSMGTWDLKGCSWSQVVSPPLSGGTYPLDGWFFEAGGGTCYMLAWKLDDGYWEIVPEWAYTTQSTPTPTTSTSTAPPETVPVTDPPTTTTVQETSTTSTTEAPSTTTEASTTSTTSSAPPPSVDTTPPATLATPPAVVQEPSTTTEPSTTAPPVSTTEAPPPPTTSPPAPDTTSVKPPTPKPTLPATTIVAPTMAPEPSVSVPVASIPPTPTLDTPQTLLEALNASPEPTQTQAAQLATNPEVLATASIQQAEAIFEALNINDLNDAQINALVEAVQEAPTEIRKAFENTINIFGAGFDNYVPVGSNIPVGVRRTLIAATGVLTVAASSIRKR